MATYVISDIHGEYDKFTRLLDKIKFKDEDTLYILGDVVDRGPDPIKTLLKMMEMPNVIPLIGNHEVMALDCLDFLCKEITEDTVENMSPQDIMNLLNWHYNGSITTMSQFKMQDEETRESIIEYLKDFEAYAEVDVICDDGTEKTFLLVHAGLGGYASDKKIEDYSLNDIVWERPDYSKPYYPDRKNFFVLTGHTPTQAIEGNPKPGYIYRENNIIDIDCGACFEGGRLAAICLETDEEFYIEDEKSEDETE